MSTGLFFSGNRRKSILLHSIGLILLLPAPGQAQDATDVNPCLTGRAASVWISPEKPAIGEPVRLIAVATDGPVSELRTFLPDGTELPLAVTWRGGPPWSAASRIDRAIPGTYRIEGRRQGETIACLHVTIGNGAKAGLERTMAEWDRQHEALYSAWIERLFDAPLQENYTYPSLEPILRDPERNFLHNHFSQGEDDKFPATPDCADLPYFLRAYFAWKMRLPLAFHACDRGTSLRPPHCGPAIIDQRFSAKAVPASTFRDLSRRLMDTVHSGSARTALEDDNTDFYPVALKRENLWPGTIYADPYGHTLVIVKWVPQTVDHSGLLLAVDAQPDNSIGRKRFWEGTFLFADDVKSAGPGFKAFRPLARDEQKFLRLLSNAELAAHPIVAPYSAEQAGLAPEDFYARMLRLINPEGLDAEEAYESMLDALVEQLEARAHSIENSENFKREHPGIIAMPTGPSIFETVGPWEDYSTPSRDLRLLIAMDVLTRFPDRIIAYPELFVPGGQLPEIIKEEIEQRHRQRIQERQIAYTRSDGSTWRLTVADILARRQELEMAYNPNDCPEVRWGARPGTAEYAPCTRRAPADQRKRMEQYRHWFREARRPSR